MRIVVTQRLDSNRVCCWLISSVLRNNRKMFFGIWASSLSSENSGSAGGGSPPVSPSWYSRIATTVIKKPTALLKKVLVSGKQLIGLLD